MAREFAEPTTEKEQSSTDDAHDVVDSVRMSFGDHLDELRARLIKALAGFAVATIICLTFGRSLLELILRPLLIVQYRNGLPPQIQALSPTSGFAAYLKIAFLSGLILAMPWVIYQIWRFVSSGLYAHERRFAHLLTTSSLALFAIGVLFLYFVVLPIMLQFFITFNRAFDVPNLRPGVIQSFVLPRSERPTPEPDAAQPSLVVPIRSEPPSGPKSGDTWVDASTRRLVVQFPAGPLSIALEPGATASLMQSQFAIDLYISFVLLLALAFGIAFETPIVVFFLAWTGLVSRAEMAGARRYVLLVAFILGALLTPPDVVSQLMLAAPMYLLFELGLLVARVAERKIAQAG